RGRAIVLRVDPADAAAAARVTLVADGLDRLLAAVGHDVERVVGPIDALAGCRAASDVARVVVLHRGRALVSSEAAAVLDRPAARFMLAGAPSDLPAVLDVDRLGSSRVDN